MTSPLTPPNPATSRPVQTGLILGKFLPPHLGHLYLVDFARRFADKLTVVVGTLQREPIPGALRHAWMRELCPGCEVLHLTDENPQEPSEHPDFWRLWRESLLRLVPRPPELLFASERYGHRLAAELGARFIPVDPLRDAIPISGTAIRAEPLRHFDLLPPPVRAHFVRRVCIFGPESTGKSTLARDLAQRFRTLAAPEYARAYLCARADADAALRDEPPASVSASGSGGAPPSPIPVRPEDMPLIARGQVASEDALARRADRVLFCDTDALTTQLWSEALFGACDPAVQALARARSYDLTLLCDVDVPFVADEVRYLPAGRQSFFERCREALEAQGRRYQILRGGFADRLNAATAAVQALLPPS